MKRRDYTTIMVFGLMSTARERCSYLGFTFGNSNEKQEKKSTDKSTGETSARRSSRRRRSLRITDLKTLSKLLQQARHPLTEMQVEYLLTLKQGPEFAEKMMDILTDSQKEAIKNASGRRRRRRR